jgi:hypothetical protein
MVYVYVRTDMCTIRKLGPNILPYFAGGEFQQQVRL